MPHHGTQRPCDEKTEQNEHTIKLKGIEHIHPRDKHAEKCVFHYRAFAEVKGSQEGKNVFQNCVFLRPHAHRVDPCADELSSRSTHSRFAITKSVAHDQLALGNR